MVSNLKWLFNRQMPFDGNVTRAKLYLAGPPAAARKVLPNGRDSAKTVQAKFMLQATHQQRIPTWAELIGEQVLSEYNLRFEVNFPCEVFSTVTEAQQFEKLGFRISPALRMSILRKEQLFEDATTVSGMIDGYNRTVEGLSLAKVGWISCKTITSSIDGDGIIDLFTVLLQIHFLRELLNEVETVIQSGLGRLTWQTFNIKVYCQKCQKVSGIIEEIWLSIVQLCYHHKCVSFLPRS